MKTELMRGCDNSLLDVEVQNSVQEAFADPSTFTPEDQPRVGSRNEVNGRWRTAGWSGSRR